MSEGWEKSFAGVVRTEFPSISVKDKGWRNLPMQIGPFKFVVGWKGRTIF